MLEVYKILITISLIVIETIIFLIIIIIIIYSQTNFYLKPHHPIQ